MYTGRWDELNRPYSFRLEGDDKDLKKKLDSMTGSERSSYIREALRFYCRFGEELKAISESVKDISAKIDNASFEPVNDLKEKNQSEADISENEEMLLDSIQDLLGL